MITFPEPLSQWTHPFSKLPLPRTVCSHTSNVVHQRSPNPIKKTWKLRCELVQFTLRFKLFVLHDHYRSDLKSPCHHRFCVVSSRPDFKYQQESCSERRRGDRQRAVGRPNTTQLLYLSLMAEPDTAVIPLKPFEESQCPTARPATCAIAIKGYYRHSSISARAEQATDTTPVHFHALPMLLLSLHPHTTPLPFFPLHLSITVDGTPFDVYAPIHQPFTLFHSISLPHSLFSSLALICLLTPPSRLSVPAGITFFASYLMSWWCNYRSGHFRNQTGFLGHFTAIFVFCCRLAWLACFRAGKQKTKQAAFTGRCKTAIQGWCINFWREKTHAESSEKHPLHYGHEGSILHGDKVLLNSAVSVN